MPSASRTAGYRRVHGRLDVVIGETEPSAEEASVVTPLD
jgi:hypothetical protein